MSNSKQVWEIYLTSKTYQVRPSTLLDIADPYAAFCLDTAVGDFGRALEAEINGVDGKNKDAVQAKRENLLRKWLDMPQKFRDPATSGHAPAPQER